MDVTNCGARGGDEVVQLYVSESRGDEVRPRLELKGFQRVHIRAGARVTVTFEVDAAQLGRHHTGLGHAVRPGVYRFSVGSSSADLPLSTILTIDGPNGPVQQEKVFFSRSAVTP